MMTLFFIALIITFGGILLAIGFDDPRFLILTVIGFPGILITAYTHDNTEITSSEYKKLEKICTVHPDIKRYATLEGFFKDKRITNGEYAQIEQKYNKWFNKLAESEIEPVELNKEWMN